MKEFLLILRGDGMDNLSPDELQDILLDYQEWVESLGDNYLAGQRLESRGSMLTSKDKPIATDGPYLESKEIIAGYFLVRAQDIEEANAIALSSPHLGLYRIEVRPLVFPKMK